jgi:MarR family transcriptional regulator, temperature-dependent positive regulator of motility
VPVNDPGNMTEDIHYQVLKILEANPEISQRELAGELGVSLGKVNYCIKALIDKGLVKARNFKNSANKRAYFYKLTPAGLEAKAKISVRFLQRKLEEYDALRMEIEELQIELGEG